MSTICKNCGHQYQGRFCNHCGQPANTHRIDAAFLWEDIQHGILHYDKGILYTIKQLFLKPGFVIKDYINRKRIHHFRPISLTIVMASLYALIYHLTKVNLIVKKNAESEIVFANILEHYYWFVLLTIPIFAWTTMVVFRNHTYNFWEYFIFESFKVSQRLIIHILILPIIFLINDPPVTAIIIKLLLFMDVALIFWTNMQFFIPLPTSKIFLLTLGSYFLCTLFVFVILVLFTFLLIST